MSDGLYVVDLSDGSYLAVLCEGWWWFADGTGWLALFHPLETPKAARRARI